MRIGVDAGGTLDSLKPVVEYTSVYGGDENNVFQCWMKNPP